MCYGRLSRYLRLVSTASYRVRGSLSGNGTITNTSHPKRRILELHQRLYCNQSLPLGTRPREFGASRRRRIRSLVGNIQEQTGQEEEPVMIRCPMDDNTQWLLCVPHPARRARRHASALRCDQPARVDVLGDGIPSGVLAGPGPEAAEGSRKARKNV